MLGKRGMKRTAEKSNQLKCKVLEVVHFVRQFSR